MRISDWSSDVCSSDLGGVKAQFGGITFNAAGFYTKINNLQVTADAGSCSSRIVFNADAHTMGLEFELSASPFTGLDLGLSGSYVEAEFDSTMTRPAGTVNAGIRCGNSLPSAHTFRMAAKRSDEHSVAEEV